MINNYAEKAKQISLCHDNFEAELDSVKQNNRQEIGVRHHRHLKQTQQQRTVRCCTVRNIVTSLKAIGTRNYTSFFLFCSDLG